MFSLCAINTAESKYTLLFYFIGLKFLGTVNHAVVFIAFAFLAKTVNKNSPHANIAIG